MDVSVMDVAAAKQAVIDAGNRLVEQGLVARTWGNVSCRVDGQRFVITPSGIAYDRLTPETIVVMDIASLSYQGDIKPSSEKGIHAAAYQASPQVGFVVHSHQPYASAISTAGLEQLRLDASEQALLGKPQRADYGLPGSKRLMRNVVKLLDTGCHTVLMERHGALLTARDSQQAFSMAKSLEDACARLLADAKTSNQAPFAQSIRGQTAADDLQQLVLQSHPAYNCVSSFASPVAAAVFGCAENGGDGRQTAAVPDDASDPQAVTHAAAVLQVAGDLQAAATADPQAVPTDPQATTPKIWEIPAMLDDFAQMAGGKLVAGSLAQPETAIASLRKLNCAWISGYGLICCSGDESDNQALHSIAEKNLLAYLAAARFDRQGPGNPKGLPAIDRFLMRWVYLSKYSKKSQGPEAR